MWVVEPHSYDPSQHAGLFGAAISARNASPVYQVWGGLSAIPFDPPRPDLITFPEAFLSEDASPIHRNSVRAAGTLWLRPRRTSGGAGHTESHLLPLEEVRRFLDELQAISAVIRKDTEKFVQWLGRRQDGHFNLGCLVTVDSRSRVRVCVHPKMVRSPYEMSAWPERHMTEADLLTLVTLRPTNLSLPTVTIQPLVCSDMLPLQTDRPDSHPLEAVNTHADCLGQSAPDHVDIVSVAACTPQYQPPDSGARRWRDDFLSSFVRTCSDHVFGRQSYAAFVLANYFEFPRGSRPGGLSGVFVPLPADQTNLPRLSLASRLIYGRFSSREDEAGWVTEIPPDEKHPPVLGHLTTLNPAGMDADTLATMFRVTLTRLPRRASRWRRDGHVTRLTAFDARREGDRVDFQQRREP